ncbi:MAG: asparagine synthase (glutamine-hydrolyzing) [Bacteroidales bacterium]
MCGITGVFSFNRAGTDFDRYTQKAVETLKMRGPDIQITHSDGPVSIGHSRLSIIDPGEQSNQPFLSRDGRIAVAFNGEFYNHKSFRKELRHEGYEFTTESDAEVVLQLYRKCGSDFVRYINGCFALAIWDSNKSQLFIARDRMGIKPLYYYHGDDFLAFGSEMKALLSYPVPRNLDTASLYAYFQLNYIPDNRSMLQDVYMLRPGSSMIITREGITENTWYRLPRKEIGQTPEFSYEEAITELRKQLDNSVSRRLMSDVPLGTFLSGGIDSSVVTALATQHSKNLHTYSLGFKDEAWFDETEKAEMLAKKFNTNHHSFKISNQDMLNDLPEVLNYLDEPFADSSALAVYSLSKLTAKDVRVALSGDGADELFAGYNKHLAHKRAAGKSPGNRMLKAGGFLWKSLPQSRQGKISNRFRQMNRYSAGLQLEAEERYWLWSSLSNEKNVSALLRLQPDMESYHARKNSLLSNIKARPDDLQEILHTDMRMVLPYDMLYKVDMMSMANSLEVRTPFLDHHVVDFAFSLPFEYKLYQSSKKRILKDSFAGEIPAELLKKPKQGFEVPLLKWFRNDLAGKLEKEVFNREFLEEQGIFQPEAVMQMKRQLHSKNPGDIHARIWALLVFQNWYRKTII